MNFFESFNIGRPKNVREEGIDFVPANKEALAAEYQAAKDALKEPMNIDPATGMPREDVAYEGGIDFVLQQKTLEDDTRSGSTGTGFNDEQALTAEDRKSINRDNK